METIQNLIIRTQKDVNNVPQEQFTRSQRKESLTTINKSALTNHATTQNHVINWDNGNKIID